MTTAILTVVAVVAAALLLFAYSLARAAADGDRMARRHQQEVILRYKGGEPGRCVVCGEIVEPRYTLNGRTIHPTCRESAA